MRDLGHGHGWGICVLVLGAIGESLVGWFAAGSGRWARKAVLGDGLQAALLAAVDAAVQRTARELRPDAPEEAIEHLAAAVNLVLDPRPPETPLANYPTLLEALQAGMAARLAILDDETLTGTGRSAAQELGIQVEQHMVQLVGERVAFQFQPQVDEDEVALASVSVPPLATGMGLRWEVVA